MAAEAWRAADEAGRGRAGPVLLLEMLLLAAAALAAAALLAPPAQRLLVRAGRIVPALVGLRDLDFVRTFDRLFVGVLASALAVYLGWGGRARRARMGLYGGRGGGRAFAGGALAGLGAVAAIHAAGWGLGALAWAPGEGGWSWWRAPVLLAGAVGVGLFEELYFRGGLYGGLRPVAGRFAAAVAASLVYAAVHFARPEPAVGVAHAGAWSGFALLPDLLRPVHGAAFYVPAVLTLFVLGLALSLLYDRAGWIYPAAGLHAGVVLGLQTGSLVLVRRPEVLPAWFGAGGSLVKGWAALVAVVVLLAAVAAVGPRGRRA